MELFSKAYESAEVLISQLLTVNEFERNLSLVRVARSYGNVTELYAGSVVSRFVKFSM